MTWNKRDRENAFFKREGVLYQHFHWKKGKILIYKHYFIITTFWSIFNKDLIDEKASMYDGCLDQAVGSTRSTSEPSTKKQKI